MRYPQEFIDKVLESSNIVEIISQYTQLKHSGNGYMGRCPFPDHQEKTASFSVSEAKQVYHCFGCKKSGNVFSFLRDYNGMNFVDALEYLADKYRIPIPETTAPSDFQSEQNDKKKQIIKLNRMAADFFQDQLKKAWEQHPIRQYVQKRKLSQETIEEFQIGYAPPEWDTLAVTLSKHKISLALAEEAKLVKARKEGNGYFDLFRDRLMFPILSPRGEVLAFGGRIHDQGEPKYLNSPETPVFSKSRVLYGVAHTAKYIRSEDAVILVEGYMDLVSLFQAGLKNVAATMGTALTVEHAKLVKRMTNNVVTLFDSDDAGQMAAERSLSILLSQGLYPKGLILTEAKDPDEYINRFGLEALKDKIEKSSDLFSVVFNSWLKDYRGEASQKVKMIDRLKPIFDSIADVRLKKLYLEEVAQKMNVGQDWVRSSLATSSNGANNFNNSAPAVRAAAQPAEVDASERLKNHQFSLAKAPQVELVLLQTVIKTRANFEFFKTVLQSKYSDDSSVSSGDGLPSYYKQFLSQMLNKDIVQILETAEESHRQAPVRFDKFFSLLLDRVDKPELLFSKTDQDFSEDSETPEEREKVEKYIRDVVSKVQQNFVMLQSKKMAQDIKQGLDQKKIQEFFELHKNRLSQKK